MFDFCDDNEDEVKARRRSTLSDGQNPIISTRRGSALTIHVKPRFKNDENEHVYTGNDRNPAFELKGLKEIETLSK